MHRARTGYRQQQDERLELLEAETPLLHLRIAELEKQFANAMQTNTQWQAAYSDLKQRALIAYNKR